MGGPYRSVCDTLRKTLEAAIEDAQRKRLEERERLRGHKTATPDRPTITMQVRDLDGLRLSPDMFEWGTEAVVWSDAARRVTHVGMRCWHDGAEYAASIPVENEALVSVVNPMALVMEALHKADAALGEAIAAPLET